MGAIGRAPGDAVAARYRVPWARKQEKALFRGRPNTHTLSRYALPYLARDGPPRATSLLDVGLVFYHHLYDPFWKANHSLTPLTLAVARPLASSVGRMGGGGGRSPGSPGGNASARARAKGGGADNLNEALCELHAEAIELEAKRDHGRSHQSRQPATRAGHVALEHSPPAGA